MDLESIFPEIEAIEDETLAQSVSSAWTTAAEQNGIELSELETVPWFPPAQRELEINAEDALLIDHVRDVTNCAIALAETLGDRPWIRDLEVDTVIGGALVHDISKLYEFDGMERTDIGRLLGHPYFGVAVASRANLPTEILHIILSHTSRTAVEPATLEAEIVRRADEVAAAGIRAQAVTDLRDT